MALVEGIDRVELERIEGEGEQLIQRRHAVGIRGLGSPIRGGGVGADGGTQAHGGILWRGRPGSGVIGPTVQGGLIELLAIERIQALLDAFKPSWLGRRKV